MSDKVNVNLYLYLNKSYFMNYYFISFIVFICGSIIMIYEMVGSRILSPFLWSSIYVWSSLIWVILASLSLWYYYWWKNADTNSKIDLQTVLFLSWVFIFTTFILKDVVLWTFKATYWFIEINTIISSIILFTPSSFFLGMITPFSVKYVLSSINNSWKKIWLIYFLSTFGSIVGTFLAGFYLIPNFWTTKIIFGLVILLMILSLIISKKFIVTKLLLSIFCLFWIYVVDTFNYQYFSSWWYLEFDTIYNKIWLYKWQDQKSGQPTLNLSTDPYGTQCSMFINKDDLVFEYTKYYRLAKYFNPELKSALAIWWCNYSYPKDFLKMFSWANIDVVEIDPWMTEISKKYFNFPNNTNLKVYHEDGRMFLNKNQKKYDVIFSDAFNSFSSIPYQLTTQEAVKRKYESLNYNWVVILNLISAVSWNKWKFLRAEYYTYKSIFDQVYIFPLRWTEEYDTQNIILVAIKWDKTFNFMTDSIELNNYLSHLRKKSIDNDTPILTDEYAPVEYYKYKTIHD